MACGSAPFALHFISSLSCSSSSLFFNKEKEEKTAEKKEMRAKESGAMRPSADERVAGGDASPIREGIKTNHSTHPSNARKAAERWIGLS